MNLSQPSRRIIALPVQASRSPAGRRVVTWAVQKALEPASRAQPPRSS
jgi:hypothetical protein